MEAICHPTLCTAMHFLQIFLHRYLKLSTTLADHLPKKRIWSNELYFISSQHVPPSVWNRFVAGLNAQLRTVRRGWIHSALIHVINWIQSHGNSQLEFHGVKIELGWFQATASGYYQLGILVVVGDYSPHSLHQSDFLECSEDCPRYVWATKWKRS